MSFKHAVRAGLAVACLVVVPAAQGATVKPYGADDAGGFRDVLPPGTNGLTNGPELAAFLATGARPRHNDDQLRMYADLVYATPGLGAADLGRYFKDSTFGVRDGDVESTISPRPDFTIVRDKGFGVPHVYGDTREGTMFGLGYAAAQDRLFFIDILRHLGRAQLSSFAGGAEGNRAFDASQWAIAPYTEEDLQRQVDRFGELGTQGQRLHADGAAYVAGINAYIAEARLDPRKMPGEYVAINRPQGPDDWKMTDLVATASLVGGIFGKGGGRELAQGELLRAFTKRFGATRGRTLWEQFAAFQDPDAPTTVKRGRFPYQAAPDALAPGAEVLPDPGSFDAHQARSSGSGGAGGGGGGQPPAPLPLPVPGAAGGAQSILGPVDGLVGALPEAMSNALVISARRSASGRPLAVFGPQTGYFAPQILMEQDVHGPGIDARGAAFAGVNLYVQLGRGRDYAWSATSAGQDIIDTYAIPLCEPGGSAPTKSSMHYRFRGQCLPIEVLERENTWQPSLADQTPPGSETLRAERTKLGLVAGRGLVDGAPTLFTTLRATYFHEVDSATGFMDFNDPGVIRDATSFQRAAHKIGYTFNWFYTDAERTAYFNSGANPVRDEGTTGQLPMTPDHEWKGYDPEKSKADVTPFEQHPQVVDQDWITSWNNRQAQGYAGADSNLFSSVYRSQMLDRQIAQRLAGGRKLTLPKLVDAMEEAGTTDLRGMIPLPLALRVIGTPSDQRLNEAVATLRAWASTGAHRVDRDRDGVYDQRAAVRLMDAWWPKLVDAMFEPVMGRELLDRLKATYQLDNAPNNHGEHLGSAYQEGFYGYVAKDLRRVLGRPVRERYAAAFCGHGDRAACRSSLRSSLKAALGTTDAQLYGHDEVCEGEAGDPQWCYDAVRFRPLGGATQPLIHWINRPTYQQAVEVKRRLPR